LVFFETNFETPNSPFLCYSQIIRPYQITAPPLTYVISYVQHSCLH